MALTKSLVWKHFTFPEAYFKINTPASAHSVAVIVGVYTNKASRDAGDGYLYDVRVNVTPEAYVRLFSENVLKLEGNSPAANSYTFLKELPEFSNCTDI